MMQLTALITVPNDWTKEEAARIVEVGLRAEIVIRWRKKHGKQSWPSQEAFNEVSVDKIKYPDPTPPFKEAGTMQTGTSMDYADAVGLARLEKEEKQPKLDRKTRGQVRRVTNKLRTVERKVFPSSSNPNRSYEAVVYQDGQVLCNCQGWTMKKPGKPRQCRHTAELIGDREVIDNGEYQFIAALVSRSPAPHQED